MFFSGLRKPFAAEKSNYRNRGDVSQFGLTGGRGDLNRCTAVTCTATAVRAVSGDYGWAAVKSNAYTIIIFLLLLFANAVYIVTLFYYFLRTQVLNIYYNIQLYKISIRTILDHEFSKLF